MTPSHIDILDFFFSAGNNCPLCSAPLTASFSCRFKHNRSITSNYVGDVEKQTFTKNNAYLNKQLLKKKEEDVQDGNPWQISMEEKNLPVLHFLEGLSAQLVCGYEYGLYYNFRNNTLSEIYQHKGYAIMIKDGYIDDKNTGIGWKTKTNPILQSDIRDIVARIEKLSLLK